MSITLCVFIGLPAVGKSTLANQIQSTSIPNTHINIFEYDKLMPENFSNDQDEHHKFKAKRKEITKNIESLIKYLLGYSENHFMFDCNEVDLCSCFDDNCDINDKINHMFLIDDNMFYRSMRYSYCQLARKYECSYCQIYLPANNINELIRRNAKRKAKVTIETIEKMSKSLEKPNLKKYIWEEQTLECNSQLDVSKIIEFLIQSSNNKCAPVDPYASIREEDRKRCFESLLHRIDQIIRKCLSKEILVLKNTHATKETISAYANLLNMKRRTFLGYVRSGNHFTDPEMEMLLVSFHSIKDLELTIDEWSSEFESYFLKYLKD